MSNPEMSVTWVKCSAGTDALVWCSLDLVDLKSISEQQGVYIIWHGGPQAHTLRVGQAFNGNIADRIGAHRHDSAVAAYRSKGLYVTWAEIRNQWVLNGVERYLASVLAPLVGSDYPDVTPISVNLPWV